MKHRTSHILFSYWDQARQGRPAPHRFDIEPSHLSPILPEALILEYRADGICYFRLAGTRICDEFGAELRATPFADFWDRADRAEVASLLAAVRDEARVAVLTFEALTRDNRSTTFELLLLPLTLNGSTYDRFLGSMACLAPPRWLGHEPITDVRLLSALTGAPEHMAPAPSPAAPPSSQARVLRGPSPDLTRRPPHRFRVIEGGRSPKSPDKPA